MAARPFAAQDGEYVSPAYPEAWTAPQHVLEHGVRGKKETAKRLLRGREFGEEDRLGRRR